MHALIFSSKFSRLLPLAAMLTVFAVSPAFAQQEEPSTMQKIFGAMGLLELPKAPIDYEERAPLVVPPSADLPQPGSPEDVRQLNPEWQVDQDIKRARAAKKESKIIDVANDPFYGENTMRLDRVKGARGDKKKTQQTASGPYDANSAGAEAYQNKERYTPSQLGFKGWGKKSDEVVFKGEPERTSLLEPPPGYLTPSPNAPYGLVEGQGRKLFSINRNYDRNDDRNDRF
jgi:hypothetical protein